MNTALITGITGFAGSHLADFLLSKKIEVCGIFRRVSKTENIGHIRDKIRLINGDILDFDSILNIIKAIKPDYIYHLASQRFVPTSWHTPHETLMTNIIGTLNILEAVRKSSCNPKIHIAGSSEEYGIVKPDELPITEETSLRPISPYAVSKIGADMLGFQYHVNYGLNIIRTRAFNHTGPREGEIFVTSNFAKQIAEIEKGKEPVIYVGNLNAQRDLSDVRDIIRAYWLSLEKCDFGEVYNICSEKTRTIQSVLDLLLSKTNKKITIKQDPSRMRSSDIEILQGNCSKFKAKTGWKPDIPLEQTIEDLLNYWRERT